MTGSGYMILAPQQGVQPTTAEVAAALEAAGWVRWAGTGLPAFVVFHTGGPKGDFFEAGYWGGRGVPVFFLGGGRRCYQRKQIVGAFGGWTVVGADGRADVGELVAAIERRGLRPGGTPQ